MTGNKQHETSAIILPLLRMFWLIYDSKRVNSLGLLGDLPFLTSAFN